MFLLIAAVEYIFVSAGMYAIARSRRIDNPWIAWIPVVNGWMLGCISDQYQSLQWGRATKRRHWIPILSVVTAALAVLAFLLIVAGAVLGEQSGVVPVLAALLAAVRLMGFLAETVAAYDLHRSCDPSNAKLLLVLGTFIPCFRAIAVFVNREKELGMPPRRVAAA